MKKFLNIRTIVTFILVIILGIMLTIYFTSENQSQTIRKDLSVDNTEQMNINNEKSSQNTIEAEAEAISGLSENIELHTTYYLSECYIQVNQEIKKGENILKYTNGEYLVAPYDCVITQLNIPSESAKCTNEHYIAISSTNILAVQFKVDEAKISEISIGQSAKIKIQALEEKEIEGYVTKISSTANNGNFTVTVEFENDGNIKLGMTTNITI